jgi:hypothetical protein
LQVDATAPPSGTGEPPVPPTASFSETVQLGLHVAVPEELRRLESNVELLRQITEATGGTLLTSEDNPFERQWPGPAGPRPWRWPAVLAMLLLLVEVAIRRGLGPRSLLAARRSRSATLAARSGRTDS